MSSRPACDPPPGALPSQLGLKEGPFSLGNESETAEIASLAMYRLVTHWFAALLLLWSLLHTTAEARTPGARRLAFLVGAEKRQDSDRVDSKFAEDDVEALSQTLKGLKFEVDLLVGKHATLDTIQRRFATFLNDTKSLSKHDVVFIGLSGSGLQMEIERGGRRVTESFFCPYDGRTNDSASLVSIGGLLVALARESGSSQNLLVIDASRNDPSRGSRGLDGSTINELPAKLSVLLSCSSGERTFESDELQHGLFTHALLEGFQGRSANIRGEITWYRLVDHVTSETPLLLEKHFSRLENSSTA